MTVDWRHPARFGTGRAVVWQRGFRVRRPRTLASERLEWCEPPLGKRARLKPRARQPPTHVKVLVLIDAAGKQGGRWLRGEFLCQSHLRVISSQRGPQLIQSGR